jgi:tetrahydromethanopterin S-methyltransferase subunit G
VTEQRVGKGVGREVGAWVGADVCAEICAEVRYASLVEVSENRTLFAVLR